jgi:hypothetical protein
MGLPVLAVFVLSVATLTVYVAPLVTLATDALVNVNASATVKALVHLALGLISAAVTDALSAHQGLRLDNAFLSSLIVTFLVSALTYLFVTKPTGISTKLQAAIPIKIGPTSIAAAVNAMPKAA